MKKLQYMLLVLPVLLTVACSSSGDEGPAPTAITFTTEVQTRAAGGSVMTDFKSGDGMLIFRSGSNSIESGNLTTYAASYSGSSWQVSPVATVSGEEKPYFFAVYPRVDASGDAVNPAAVPVRVADQVDVLYSGQGEPATESNPTVAFKMHHAMAIIAFNIQSYVVGTLKRIKVGNDRFPAAGTLRVTRGNITTTEYGAFEKSFNQPLTTTGWTKDHPAMFVIPHTIGAEGMPVELTIDDRTYTFTIPSMRLTLANKYIYYVMVTPQGTSLLEDKTETIDLMGETQPLPEVSYGHISLLYQGSELTVPTITGTGLYGMVHWGNGEQTAYKEELKYTYPMAGNYTVGFDLWNVEDARVTYSNLDGLKEIDFSKF